MATHSRKSEEHMMNIAAGTLLGAATIAVALYAAGAFGDPNPAPPRTDGVTFPNATNPTVADKDTTTYPNATNPNDIDAD